MTKGHKANVHGAAVGHGGLAAQMARRTRQDGSTAGGEGVNSTSIFDPVLAELLYRWFAIPEAVVLDPFAGGSVRGIVANRLGLAYYGIDLSERQIIANREQSRDICTDGTIPMWAIGDSNELLNLDPFKTMQADFILTCPPYVDLERYSTDPRDISTMKYTKFFSVFTSIMTNAVSRLRDDRFMAIVTSDVRDKKTGAYHGFPAHTVSMLQRCGLKLWNEIPYVTPPGSLATRTKLGFERGRKMGRTHQVVHVFLKGDPKAAVEALGECEFSGDDPLNAMGEFSNPFEGLGKVL